MKIRSAHADVRPSLDLLYVSGGGSQIEFHIVCGGQVHRVIWKSGRVQLPDHSGDDHQANRAFRALGGPPGECFLLEEWLVTGVHFES